MASYVYTLAGCKRPYRYKVLATYPTMLEAAVHVALYRRYCGIMCIRDGSDGKRYSAQQCKEAVAEALKLKGANRRRFMDTETERHRLIQQSEINL